MDDSKVVHPVKDATSAQPIPHAWRDSLAAIVSALRSRDYALSSLPHQFVKPTTEDAARFEEAIAAYGARLDELPSASWDTSVCMWYGTRWDAIVDLWTVEEGRSDLVLHATVTEVDDGYRFAIHMVYVP